MFAHIIRYDAVDANVLVTVLDKFMKTFVPADVVGVTTAFKYLITISIPSKFADGGGNMIVPDEANSQM